MFGLIPENSHVHSNESLVQEAVTSSLPSPILIVAGTME